MICLIAGNHAPLIKKRIKAIVKENILDEIDDFNFIKFRADEVSLLDVIDECVSIPLGYEKKVVSLENCDFIAEETKKLREDPTYQEFLKYLSNPNDSTILILSNTSTKVDTKSEIYKTIENTCKKYLINDPTDAEWNQYTKNIFDRLGVQIDSYALQEFIVRTKGDIDLMKNEAEKLALYKTKIDIDDVTLMVNKPLDDQVFDIFNDLITNKKSLALECYRNLIQLNTEPIAIVAALASSFRTYNEVLYLYNNGKDAKEIAKELHIKEGKAYITLKNIHRLSKACISRSLDELYELDLQLKSGLLDRNYLIELFIVNFKTI